MEPLWVKLVSIGVAAAGVSVALFAFLKGRREYVRAQQWKEAEYIAQEMKAMFATPHYRDVTTMLDWEGRAIPLIPQADGTMKDVLVGSDLLKRALVSHRRVSSFDAEETAVRDVFTRFFDDWNKLGHYLQTGLVKLPGIEPYIKYYLDLLADKGTVQRKAEVRFAIYEFIVEYGYLGVQYLFNAYGFDIAAAYKKLREDLSRPALPEDQPIKLPSRSGMGS